ncbi:Predicted oxidoreductase [Tistlia consotensis]|uniref:Predicted oxidoreductase n=1 Tax=Tistlia consotensis USBA 355 TaxID=560819 RepID=A0A1Y6CUK1_9PROT|nr:aldo/keto reductase [Tistlia consotensis]SMF78150.1 Predicted oxidoreductase [Tistlia consotensis USBA 355]SNS17914.1 Predicted oxidoreductase [Tistlia consotensis]
MDMRRLGRSDIQVSKVCLGTMTWGTQNSQDEAFEQMDYALERGVTFWDTAEMYPTPTGAETYGETERIIGNWLASRGGRERVVLATKAVGPNPTRFPYIRDGKPRLNRWHLERALDASLKRLQTDYLDLYQLHWPDRSTNHFGKLGYVHDPDEDSTPIAETLAVLAGFVTAGKVRTVGLSNETPWGVMSFLKEAEAGVGPRPVSIQNPYSLLNRSFEVGLAEVAMREAVGLLAYAPIAGGTLSGKYLDGHWPEGARMTVSKDNRRYFKPNSEPAIRAYVELARDHGLEPATLAHAFVYGREFLTASIVGATSVDQLKVAIDAAEVTLGSAVLEAIEAIHQRFTIPCP